jgi:acetylornithine/N-succinyldiaminopimelate aminotransferase
MEHDENKALIERAERYLIGNYKQQPIVLERGQGCSVWDVAGTRYLDLTAGIAACPLGHAHPRLTAAIHEQAGRLIHVSNLFFVERQIRLAERLAELVAPSMGPVRAFFCNSGAEANEAAIKLAKRYQTSLRGRPERTEVLAFAGSFHGRTVATVGLTGQEKYRTGFGPLIEWGRFLPWPESENSYEQVLRAISERTCAVLIEPIQAEGGIRMPPPRFLQTLRERCTATGTVLIFDEVQTGVGRCGEWFGHQIEGVVPDIMSLAKGLAGGVPIGAILATEELARAFVPGSHASTFGGNPLATGAGLAVLDIIRDENLLEHVRRVGEHLGRGLERLQAKHSRRAVDVRGRGLLRGLALGEDAVPVVAACRAKRVLLSVAGGTVVRFAPPLIVTEAELDQGLAVLDEALAS